MAAGASGSPALAGTAILANAVIDPPCRRTESIVRGHSFPLEQIENLGAMLFGSAAWGGEGKFFSRRGAELAQRRREVALNPIGAAQAAVLFSVEI